MRVYSAFLHFVLFFLISRQCESASLGVHNVVISNLCVHLTCLIVLPCMFNSDLLILYFFRFGEKVIKFVFSCIINHNNESLLVLNQIENLFSCICTSSIRVSKHVSEWNRLLSYTLSIIILYNM